MACTDENQIRASIFIGCLTGLNVGAVLGFSAILLPQLPAEITLSEKSWIASICNLGQLVGALAAGFISNKIGRKNCLLLFTIPLMCGWLTLIYNHQNVIIANIGRVLQGLGMMPSIGQVYLIEALDTLRRETLGASLAIFISVGITLTYALGAILHWIVVAWIFIGLIFLQIIGLYFFVPESPQWLMSQGLEEEAEASWKRLRGSDTDFSAEKEAFKAAMKSAEANNSGLNLWREFLKPEAYKPLGLLMCLWFLQQFSGNYAVVFYAVDIFDGIGEMHDHMDCMTHISYISAISVGSIRILGSVLGAFFLKKKFSRRLLMTVSAMGMFLAMLAMAVVEHVKLHYILPYSLTTALMVVSSSSFILFHAIGFNVIPMLLLGELCPVKLKGLTSGLTIAFVAILVFTVVKFFPLAMTILGASATYGFFSAVCLTAAFFTFYLIPETRGKNVNELQDLYSKNNNNVVEPEEEMANT